VVQNLQTIKQVTLAIFSASRLLDYQRRMKEQHGRNNLETVFGVTALPYGRLGAEGTDRSGAGVGVDKAAEGTGRLDAGVGVGQALVYGRLDAEVGVDKALA
jgi:hypothetical protein